MNVFFVLFREIARPYRVRAFLACVHPLGQFCTRSKNNFLNNCPRQEHFPEDFPESHNWALHLKPSHEALADSFTSIKLLRVFRSFSENFAPWNCLLEESGQPSASDLLRYVPARIPSQRYWLSWYCKWLIQSNFLCNFYVNFQATEE